MKTISIEKLKATAKDLLDDGSNIEYTRGICELLADVDGIEDMPHAERALQIAIELNLAYYDGVSTKSGTID